MAVFWFTNYLVYVHDILKIIIITCYKLFIIQKAEQLFSFFFFLGYILVEKAQEIGVPKILKSR